MNNNKKNMNKMLQRVLFNIIKGKIMSNKINFKIKDQIQLIQYKNIQILGQKIEVKRIQDTNLIKNNLLKRTAHIENNKDKYIQTNNIQIISKLKAHQQNKKT